MRSRLSSPAIVTSNRAIEKSIVRTWKVELDNDCRFQDLYRAWRSFQSEIQNLQSAITHTTVTSIPPCFNARRSVFGALRSVMTACTAEDGAISDRLRRPNLLESQTATVLFATSTITRFTFASSKFGVLRPKCTSKPSTPR